MAKKPKPTYAAVTAPTEIGDLFLPKTAAWFVRDDGTTTHIYRVKLDDVCFGSVSIEANVPLPEGLTEPSSVNKSALLTAARRAGATTILRGAALETLNRARALFISLKEPQADVDRMVLARPGSAALDALTDIRNLYQVAKADDAIDEMNAKHFLTRVGSSTVIGLEESDGEIVFQRPYDVAWNYKGENVQVGTSGRGATPIYRTKFEIWLDSDRKRRYRKVVFKPTPCLCDPNDYNLWKGFAVEPIKGECSKFLEHTHKIICSGNDDHFKYLLDLLALTVQEPGNPCEIAVVLKGEQGTGKGVFVRSFGSLFGRHYIQVDKTDHITGRFNSQLAAKVVVFADEAVWAGNKRDIGPLKRLITEPTLTIERKGIDVMETDNHVHLFMATNEKWAAPVGFNERRFFMLDVSDAKMQDQKYFDPIYAEMKVGGREALLHLLLDRTFDRSSLRMAPKTNALRDQQDLALPSELQWWKSCLWNGELDEGDGWPPWISIERLYWSYLHMCEQQRTRRRIQKSEITKALPISKGRMLNAEPRTRQWSPIFHENGKPMIGADGKPVKDARHGHTLPTLTECRKAFDVMSGLAREWPEVGSQERELFV